MDYVVHLRIFSFISFVPWYYQCFKHRSGDPLHEHKITSESQHMQTVMEKVESTPWHSWLHSSCLVAQQENSSPARSQKMRFHQLLSIGLIILTLPELIHTSHARLVRSMDSRASVCIPICGMQYLILFYLERRVPCLLPTEGRGLSLVV